MRVIASVSWPHGWPLPTFIEGVNCWRVVYDGDVEVSAYQTHMAFNIRHACIFSVPYYVVQSLSRLIRCYPDGPKLQHGEIIV